MKAQPLRVTLKSVGLSELPLSELNSLARYLEARATRPAAARFVSKADTSDAAIQPLRPDLDPILESFCEGAEQVVSALAVALDRWQESRFVESASGHSGHQRDPSISDPAVAFERERIANRYWALLESMPLPTAVCAGDGAILSANLLMEEVLAATNGIFAMEGKLKCVVASENGLLADLLRHSALDYLDCKTSPCRKISITRECGAAPLVLLASPLRSGHIEKGSSLNPEILVRIVIPERRRLIDGKDLSEMFHLTRSESALCTSLVQTGNLDRAAALCGLTIGSARQYLKRIFTKTNTSGQVELVSLILQLPLL